MPVTTPVTRTDTVTTPAGQPVTIDVLANDTHTGPVTITPKTQPTHGTVSCTSATCTYTPAAGFAGTDSFTYTITDASGATSTSTVTLSVTATTTLPSPQPPAAGDAASPTAGGPLLPTTGAETGILTCLAGASLLAGFAFCAAGRRRRTAR